MGLDFKGRAAHTQTSTWLHFYDTGVAERAIRHLFAVWGVVLAALCVVMMIMGLKVTSANASEMKLALLPPASIERENAATVRFVPKEIVTPQIAEKCEKPSQSGVTNVAMIYDYRRCVGKIVLQHLRTL